MRAGSTLRAAALGVAALLVLGMAWILLAPRGGGAAEPRSASISSDGKAAQAPLPTGSSEPLARRSVEAGGPLAAVSDPALETIVRVVDDLGIGLGGARIALLESSRSATVLSAVDDTGVRVVEPIRGIVAAWKPGYALGIALCDGDEVVEIVCPALGGVRVFLTPSAASRLAGATVHLVPPEVAGMEGATRWDSPLRRRVLPPELDLGATNRELSESLLLTRLLRRAELEARGFEEAAGELAGAALDQGTARELRASLGGRLAGVAPLAVEEGVIELEWSGVPSGAGYRVAIESPHSIWLFDPPHELPEIERDAFGRQTANHLPPTDLSGRFEVQRGGVTLITVDAYSALSVRGSVGEAEAADVRVHVLEERTFPNPFSGRVGEKLVWLEEHVIDAERGSFSFENLPRRWPLLVRASWRVGNRWSFSVRRIERDAAAEVDLGHLTPALGRTVTISVAPFPADPEVPLEVRLFQHSQDLSAVVPVRAGEEVELTGLPQEPLTVTPRLRRGARGGTFTIEVDRPTSIVERGDIRIHAWVRWREE